MDAAALKLRPTDTRQRLLEAAARVFATHGFDSATTREIAHEAGVNEVTLFRLFQTKENLQGAVLRRVFDQQAEFLAAQPRELPSAGLHAALLRIAQSYQAVLRHNISLVRAVIGGMNRFGANKPALDSIFEPLRVDLIGTLEAARDAGLLRPGVDPLIAASLIPGAILTDLLKRSSESQAPPPYPSEEFLATVVEIFVRGVLAAPPATAGEPARS